MRMRTLIAVIMAATAMASGHPAVAADDIEARVEASRAVAKDFAQTLQQALQTALATDGPVAAIEVCNVAAPAIAAQQSSAHGWQVGRTSLQPRNPANTPDAWQRTVLTRFAAEKAAGKPVAALETWEVADVDGKPAFRYMKAIPTSEVCLSCHGSNLAPELATKLAALYPADQATGYALGDIRGAFTVTQPLP